MINFLYENEGSAELPSLWHGKECKTRSYQSMLVLFQNSL